MIIMWIFYRKYSHRSYDIYHMPLEVMRVGMACAAQYIHSSTSDWHRCVITGFSTGFVQVDLVFSLVNCSLFVFRIRYRNH